MREVYDPNGEQVVNEPGPQIQEDMAEVTQLIPEHKLVNEVLDGKVENVIVIECRSFTRNVLLDGKRTT